VTKIEYRKEGTLCCRQTELEGRLRCLITRKENNVTGKKEKGEGGSKDCKRKVVRKDPERKRHR
jgi:hypothetical protein